MRTYGESSITNYSHHPYGSDSENGDWEIMYMENTGSIFADSPYKGSGSLTREQFYFYEMRTTARLLCQGLGEKEVSNKIKSENLFQFPTERTVNQAVSACLKRLSALEDDALVRAIAEQDSYTAKQICLYAMMKQYRLMWDFMITVIGNKYRQQDYTFSRRDVLIFLMQLQEQDAAVASWTEATIKKIVSVIIRILIENEYLESSKADRLNTVMITSLLENAIQETGTTQALSAFNCFS